MPATPKIDINDYKHFYERKMFFVQSAFMDYAASHDVSSDYIITRSSQLAQKFSDEYRSVEKTDIGDAKRGTATYIGKAKSIVAAINEAIQRRSPDAQLPTVDTAVIGSFFLIPQLHPLLRDTFGADANHHHIIGNGANMHKLAVRDILQNHRMTLPTALDIMSVIKTARKSKNYNGIDFREAITSSASNGFAQRKCARYCKAHPSYDTWPPNGQLREEHQ